MKILYFKKIYEDESRRFYELSEPVYRSPLKGFELKERVESIKGRLKPEYQYLIPEFIRMVCVSDAHTHIERLMFVGAKTRDDKYICLTGIQLDGRHTMMIEGGDARHVHPDSVYLRRLASANGFKFEML
jgi:hypothetical protein